MKTSRTGKNSGMRTGALGTALWLSVLAAMSGCDDGNDNGDSAVGATQQDLPWVIASGEAQQAAPNTGYIAFNYESPVAITLPSTLAVGDVVAVVGAASGGWELRQNAGQYIVAEGEVGDVWIKRASYSGWMDVASCADGTRLVAADFPRSHLYFSDDSGLTWAARGPTNPWSSVACSTDGNGW